MKRAAVAIAVTLIVSSCALDAAVGGAAQGAAEVQAAADARQLLETVNEHVAAGGQVAAPTGDCATDTAALNRLIETTPGASSLNPTDRNAATVLYLSVVAACDDVPDGYRAWSR